MWSFYKETVDDHGLDVVSEVKIQRGFFLVNPVFYSKTLTTRSDPNLDSFVSAETTLSHSLLGGSVDGSSAGRADRRGDGVTSQEHCRGPTQSG